MDYFKKKALKFSILTSLYWPPAIPALWFLTGALYIEGNPRAALAAGIVALGIHAFCLVIGYKDHYRYLLDADTKAPPEPKIYERLY
tara:strand:+ start:142 stop:402 length:261 start_codon:yes stop_codon:yes gene_type:complete